MRKSDTSWSHKYEPLKNEKFKNQKDFKAKKNHFTANSKNRSKNGNQSDQALDWFSTKDFHSNKRSQQSQFFNIPAIGSNTTIVKKHKK